MPRTLAAILLVVPTVARAAPVAGDTVLVAGTWFQYLGRDAAAPASELYLYPHLDGVGEVFRAGEGSREWTGDLDSRFDHRSGAMENRFSAAEVLNELLDRRTPRDGKRRAARLLKLFVALHGPPVPYYIEEHMRVVERWSEPDDDDWVRETLAARAAATGPAGELGTRVPDLRIDEQDVAAPYYRELLQDGYLDVAIVGGNSYDKWEKTFHSWSLAEDLSEELTRDGFDHVAFRSADDRSLGLKTTHLAGAPIQIRIVTTAASVQEHRILRATANLIEGLAHADVVAFLGHSNHGSGSYFTSETRSAFSRFRIGGSSPRDLDVKCHGLDRERYRIVALQSCSSFEKYCLPLLRHFDALGRGERVGVLGLADKGYLADIVPRFEAFLEEIFSGDDARTIHARLQSIRPASATPHVVLRGVLQPRHSFIVPRSVSIVRVEDSDEAPWVPHGIGDDGHAYPSTGVFPQATGGEIVQVLELPRAVLGLSRDGVIYEVSEDTRGAAVAWEAARGVARFVYLARVSRPGRRPTLGLVARDGVIYQAVARDGARRASVQAPEGVRARAIWNDEEGRLCVECSRGERYAWKGARRGFVVDASATDAGRPVALTDGSGVLRVAGGER